MSDAYAHDPGARVPDDLLREAGIEPPTDPYASYDAEKLAELTKRGKPHNLAPAEVEAADSAGMPLDEAQVMRDATSLADVEAGMEQLRRDRAAREEAERQAAVDLAAEAIKAARRGAA